MNRDESRRAGDPGGLRHLHFIPATELDGQRLLVARELLHAYHVFALHLREEAAVEESGMPTLSEWLTDEHALILLPAPERVH